MMEPNEISIKGYIDRFEPWLVRQGLTQKTIRRHINNIWVFLDYLSKNFDITYEEELVITDEVLTNAERVLDGFFGYDMRHKLFATKDGVRQYASSIRKFYKWLAVEGIVSDDIKDDILSYVKSELPFWSEMVEGE